MKHITEIQNPEYKQVHKGDFLLNMDTNELKEITDITMDICTTREYRGRGKYTNIKHTSKVLKSGNETVYIKNSILYKVIDIPIKGTI